MVHIDKQDLDVLLHVHDAWRQESMGHRQSIFNTFSLSMVGFLAVLAGVLAPGALPGTLKVLVSIAVVVAALFMTAFIIHQRRQSEVAMNVVRRIEEILGMYERDRFIPAQALLPEPFSRSHASWIGLSPADWLQILAISLLATGITIIVIISPTPPT